MTTTYITDQNISGYISSSTYYDHGASSSNSVIDWSNGQTQLVTLDNNPNITFSNAQPGELNLLFKVVGLSSPTISWPNNVLSNANGNFPPFSNTIPNIDKNFNTGTGADDIIYTSARQSDGKILVAGIFSTFNGDSINGLVRLNENGSIDNTFTIGIGFQVGLSESPKTIAIQSDDKILLGGNFTKYSGDPSYPYIVRLNTNGAPDNTFVIGSSFDGAVNVIKLQSDGKILVGGNFSDYDGNTVGRIVRLNSDGSIDNTFMSGIGFNNVVEDIAIQSNGDIIVGGQFTGYDGTTVGRIVKLDSGGTIDSLFNTGTGFNNTVTTIAIQSDGYIIAGGKFTSYDGNSVGRIIRLHPIVGFDIAFVTGSGFNGNVQNIVIQSDGKILVGGDFSQYNGSFAGRLMRINSDGTASSFNANFNSTVYDIIYESGLLTCVGSFTTCQGSVANRIVQLNEFIPYYRIVRVYYDGDFYVLNQ